MKSDWSQRVEPDLQEIVSMFENPTSSRPQTSEPPVVENNSGRLANIRAKLRLGR